MKRNFLFKYITSKIIPALFFSLILCLFLSELIGISFEQMRLIADSRISISTSAYIHILVIPKFILITMPYALLMANIFTYSNLSKSSEIVAFLSFGISINKIVMPSFLLSILISIATFYFQELLVIESNYKVATLFEQSINASRSNIVANDFVYSQFNSIEKKREVTLLLLAKKASNNTMEDLTLIYFNHGHPRQIIIAQSAYWIPKEKMWLLNKGTKDVIDNAKYTTANTFKTYGVKIGDTLNMMLAKNKYHNELNISELAERSQKFRETGHRKEFRQIEESIQNRFITVFSCIIFSLIGALIGIDLKPKSMGKEFSLGLIIIFSYYALQFISSSLVGSEFIPVWGIWAPIVCGLVFIATRLLNFNSFFRIALIVLNKSTTIPFQHLRTQPVKRNQFSKGSNRYGR